LQRARSKYIEDQLKMGAEVIIADTKTKEVLINFDPFPDDQNVWEEYRRRIRENLERANKIIVDGVSKGKTTGSLGVQVIIRPVKKTIQRSSLSQKKLDIF
jgi:hypothetical protein